MTLECNVPLSAFSEAWVHGIISRWQVSVHYSISPRTHAFEKVEKPEKPTTEKGLDELEYSEMLKGQTEGERIPA